MAAFIRVGLRPAPVLSEEERQPVPGTVEVVVIGIERQEHVVALDALVEAVHETLEEGHASHGVVQGLRFLLVHDPECTEPRP